MPWLCTTSLRHRAYLAVTSGLGLAYLLAALALARPGKIADFGWPSRFNIWSGFLLVLLVLYGGAWLLGRQLPTIPRRPPRAGWRGAAYGVLILLVLVVLVGGWNAMQEVIRFVPFPGTTAADFLRHVGNSCYDYIVKPLAYIMPLGSILAGLLGWWVGRRAPDSST